MNASDYYKPYYRYLEVNFTIEDEKPPQIYFQVNLKKGRRLND